jgi:hypothetical protein
VSTLDEAPTNIIIIRLLSKPHDYRKNVKKGEHNVWSMRNMKGSKSSSGGVWKSNKASKRAPNKYQMERDQVLYNE